MKLLGIIGSIGLFLGVAIGAFGAHALRDQLTERMREVFETGVRYQMYHSLAILFAAFMVQRGIAFHWAGLLYTAGIILFSFSLYLLAYTEIRWLGAITPIGGLCFLAGHLLMIVGFIKLQG